MAINRGRIAGQIVAWYLACVVSCRITIFWTIMMITSQVEPKYSCFWPFMGHSQIITRLWCIIYKLLLPDLSKNSIFILKNSANNSVFNSVFNSRSSNSTLIHQFYDSALTWLRLQSFDITTNLESGPHFAKICFIYKRFAKLKKNYTLFFLFCFKPNLSLI